MSTKHRSRLPLQQKSDGRLSTTYFQAESVLINGGNWVMVSSIPDSGNKHDRQSATMGIPKAQYNVNKWIPNFVGRQKVVWNETLEGFAVERRRSVGFEQGRSLWVVSIRVVHVNFHDVVWR